MTVDFLRAGDGTRIAYESTPAAAGAAGSAGSVPIAFLNGIAMSIAHWKPYVEAFSGERPCLCHDMRGQLLSGKPETPYSLELHARDFLALLDSLGLGRVHVAGTSYGAEVAMEFAVRYPERCASLFLVDGVSESDPLLDAAVESWRAAALADPFLFYKAIVPWNYSAAYMAANGEALARRGQAVASLPAEYFRAFAALCDSFSAIDITPRLGRISCPAMVVYGEKDILKHGGFARIIAGGIPGAELREIADAGHAVAIEKPAELIAELRGFLGRAETRAGLAGTGG